MNLVQSLRFLLDPVAWARSLGFEPDPLQSQILRSRAQKLSLNCTRQFGKSTLAALLGLHQATFRPNSLVLVLSPSLRQSGELFKKITTFYDNSLPADSETKRQLALANGSRIISLPGTEKTVRGFSGVDLLIVDEASRVSDELYQAVRPMLAVSGGRLIVLSTPFGKRGFFWEIWKHRLPEWSLVEIPASKCERIQPEFLETERSAVGDFWFDQEYCCVFHETIGSVFTDNEVDSVFVDDLEPFFSSERKPNP